MSRPDPDDERYGVELLRPLAVDPHTPSRIDLSQAMTVGRRRRRTRRIAGAAATAAAITAVLAVTPAVLAGLNRGPDRGPVADTPASVAPPSPAAPTCTVSTLPVPRGGTQAIVLGGDPSGRWLVGRHRTGATGVYDVLLWKDGRLVSGAALPGTSQTMNDVNGAGLAVGQAGSGGEQPYAYADGVTRKLRGAGAGGRALAVNEAGVIVGRRQSVEEHVPVRWASPSAAAEDLPLPAGYPFGQAVGIDERGTVVGAVHRSTDRTDGYVWRPDGTAGFLPRAPGGNPFVPFDVRDGWVIGSTTEAGSSGEVYGLLNLATGTYRMLTGRPYAVNSGGWTAGQLYQERSVLDAGGVDVLLPQTLLGENERGSIARTLSDDGRLVAGWGIRDNRGTVPLLWRCR